MLKVKETLVLTILKDAECLIKKQNVQQSYNIA